MARVITFHTPGYTGFPDGILTVRADQIARVELKYERFYTEGSNTPEMHKVTRLYFTGYDGDRDVSESYDEVIHLLGWDKQKGKQK